MRRVFDCGSKMWPLHSQFKPEEVTESSLMWGPVWLLRLWHSFQLMSKSAKGLREELLLIPSKLNLRQPVSNSSKALSSDLCIRPCFTYEGECVFSIFVFVCVCVRVCVCVCMLMSHAVKKNQTHVYSFSAVICRDPKCSILNREKNK